MKGQRSRQGKVPALLTDFCAPQYPACPRCPTCFLADVCSLCLATSCMSMAIPGRSVLLAALSPPPADTHALPARRSSPRRGVASPSRRKSKNRRALLQFTPLLVRSTTFSNNSFSDLRDALPSGDFSHLRVTESLLGEENRRLRASSRCYGPFFSAYKSHSPADRRCPLVSLRQRPPPLREYILQLPKLPVPRSSR